MWMLLASSSCIDAEPPIDEHDAGNVPFGQGPVGQASSGQTSGGSSASSGPTCTPASGASACGVCLDAQCCAEETACAESGPCSELLDCEVNCSDPTCSSHCETQYPDGLALLNATLNCGTSSCPVCAEVDAGPSSGSGSSSTSSGSTTGDGGPAISAACQSCTMQNCASQAVACIGDSVCASCVGDYQAANCSSNVFFQQTVACTCPKCTTACQTECAAVGH